MAGLLVAAGLALHPVPQGGLEERPSIVSTTPLWGPIHVAIALGFVLCVLAGLLALVAGGVLTRRWTGALAWGCFTVGILFFTGVALVNGYVLHTLSNDVGTPAGAVVYRAFDDLLIGYGWLGNPLFLVGLTGIALVEVRERALGIPRSLALFGLAMALLSWLRGIGSASGLYFLEPFIYANVPAFLWLSVYGWRMASLARRQEG